MYYKKRSEKFNAKIDELINEYNKKMQFGNSDYALTTVYVNGLLDLLGEKIENKMKEPNGKRDASVFFRDTFKEFSKTLIDKTTNDLLDFSKEFGTDFGGQVSEYSYYLKVINDVINQIGVGYAYEHNIEPLFVESFGGIKDTEIEERASKIYKRERTLKAVFEKTLPTNQKDKLASLVNKLDNARKEVLLFKDTISEERYTTIIDRAVMKYESLDKHVDNSNDAERAAGLLQNMAVAYSTLREEYNKQTNLHKWFTWAGWQESMLINKTRKQMMDVMFIQNDKRFNELAEKVCTKESDFTYYFKENLKKKKDEFNANKSGYMPAARRELKILTDDDGVIDISDDLVNEGAQNIIIEEKVDSKENPELITIKEN